MLVPLLERVRRGDGANLRRGGLKRLFWPPRTGWMSLCWKQPAPPGRMLTIRYVNRSAGALMQSAAISYFKRYKMEVDLAGLPAPQWPLGFQPVAWRPDLLEAHADVLCQCFHDEVDALVFPSLGNRDGCIGLMAEIARRGTFIPEATWLLPGPEGAVRQCAGARANAACSGRSRTSASSRPGAAGGWASRCCCRRYTACTRAGWAARCSK